MEGASRNAGSPIFTPLSPGQIDEDDIYGATPPDGRVAGPVEEDDIYGAMPPCVIVASPVKEDGIHPPATPAVGISDNNDASSSTYSG